MKAAKAPSDPAAHIGRLASSASGRVRLVEVAPAAERIGSGSRLSSVAVRRLWWKRSFDLVLGSFFFLLSVPILAVGALLILAEDGGSIFFLQERIGQGGRKFRIIKLRTMRPLPEGEEHASGNGESPFIKVKGDERITRLGRWLRVLAIDELPQLLNVIRGQMSLVGPRPFVESEMSHCRPRQWQRLAVPPGMTGLAQVSGSADLGLDEIVERDLDYVENCSLWLDAIILLRTLHLLLGNRRGMY